MANSGWIAYVGAFMFPVGQAGSRRVYGIACSLADSGYRVVVGSGESAPFTPSMIEGSNRKDNLFYLGLGEFPPPNASVIEKSYRWFASMGEQTVQWLEGQKEKPACVILFFGYAPFMVRLLHWCKKNHVPLISDVVEWYDHRHLQGGLFGPFNLSVTTALHFLYPKSDGIIAISSYLERYYRSRGCRVLRVPPTLDTHNIEVRDSVSAHTSTHLNLAYTGVPGKKDLLNNVVEAILRFDPQGKRIRLALAGSNAESILLLPALNSRRFNQIPQWMDVLGPLPYESAMNLVRNADFMPLLRPPLRYAQAGFPTKVTESLAVGTPVICNITSDLGEYIHDGQEGLICRDHSVEAFTESLESALSLSLEQRADMRKAARRQAERSFDYHVYTEPLSLFLKEVLPCV